MMKRVFDFSVSVVGIFFLLPALAAIAVLIKLDSPGPVLYRGVRIGRYGIPFKVYKFRTMVVNAEHLGGTSTGRNDPRVTRIGRVLRKYKLDEFPQLFNVLKGEMSFVGPRPEVEEYTSLYTEEEQVILSVRPGITDFASLEFIDLGELLGNDDPDYVYRNHIRPKKNALRLKYVQEQSFLVDLEILLRTLASLLHRSEARSIEHKNALFKQE